MAKKAQAGAAPQKSVRTQHKLELPAATALKIVTKHHGIEPATIQRAKWSEDGDLTLDMKPISENLILTLDDEKLSYSKTTEGTTYLPATVVEPAIRAWHAEMFGTFPDQVLLKIEWVEVQDWDEYQDRPEGHCLLTW